MDSGQSLPAVTIESPLATGEAPLLSVQLASNRPRGLLALLDNLQETAERISAFEVLVNIDSEDEAMHRLVEREAAVRPFRLAAVATPRAHGAYSRGYGFARLFRATDPRAYFLINLSDEVRIATRGWDRVLEGYRGFHPDHVFRLRISEHRRRNYPGFHSTLPCPENFAVFTQAWLALTNGWGGSWGTDSWHQAVEYCLGRSPHPGLSLPRLGPVPDDDQGRVGYFRGIAIDGIVLEGTQAGRGETDVARRAAMIRRERLRLASYPVRLTLHRLACRLQALIEAGNWGVDDLLLRERHRDRVLLVEETASGRELARLPYDPGRLATALDNLPHWVAAARREPMGMLRFLRDLPDTRRHADPVAALPGGAAETVRRVRTGPRGVTVERIAGGDPDAAADFHG